MPLNEIQTNSVIKRSSSLAKIDGLIFKDFDIKDAIENKENLTNRQMHLLVKYDLTKSKSLNNDGNQTLSSLIKTTNEQTRQSDAIDVKNDSSCNQKSEIYFNNDEKDKAINWISLSSSLHSALTSSSNSSPWSKVGSYCDLLEEVTFVSSDESSSSFMDSFSESKDKNQIDYELVKSLLDNELNRIRIQSSKIINWTNATNTNRIEGKQFADLVFIVETFNKIIVKMYKTTVFANDTTSSCEIEIAPFVSSILSNVSKISDNESSFERVVFRLLRILFFLNNKILLNDLTIFTLDADVFFTKNAKKDVLLESKVISLELLTFFVIKSLGGGQSSPTEKCSNFYYSIFKPNGPRSVLLQHLDRVESINELSVANKLVLCTHLINEIMESKKHQVMHLTYKERILELNEEVETLTKDLNKLIYHRTAIASIHTTYLTEIKRLRNMIKLKEREISSIARIEPFGFFEVTEKNFSFYFWHLDCMHESLIIEKRFHYSTTTDLNASNRILSDENEENSLHIDSSNILESEWFIIENLVSLRSLFEVINLNSIDSKLANGLLKLIEHIEKTQRSSSFGECVETSALMKTITSSQISKTSSNNNKRNARSELSFSVKNFKNTMSVNRKGKFSTVESRLNEVDQVGLVKRTERSIFESLIGFKLRLAESNLLHVHLSFNKDKVLDGFRYSDSFVQLSELENQLTVQLMDTKSYSSSERFENLKLYTNLLFQSIGRENLENRFYINSISKHWMNQLESAKTLNKLEFLIFVLENNVKWHFSLQDVVCNICITSNAFLEKQKCGSCGLQFHLQCLLDAAADHAKKTKNKQNAKSSKNEEDYNTETFEIGLCKYRTGSLICFVCRKSKEAEFEKNLAKQQSELFIKQNELNSVQNSKYRLRLNKARQENLEKIYNVDDDEETVGRRRTKKPSSKASQILKSSSSSSAATKENCSPESDKEYQPTTDNEKENKKKNRGKRAQEKRKRAKVPSYSDDDNDDYEARPKRKASVKVAEPRERTQCRYSLRDKIKFDYFE